MGHLSESVDRTEKKFRGVLFLRQHFQFGYLQGVADVREASEHDMRQVCIAARESAECRDSLALFWNHCFESGFFLRDQKPVGEDLHLSGYQHMELGECV